MKSIKNKDKIVSWGFLLPTLIFLAITALFPLLYSVYLSFFRMKLNQPHIASAFVGFDNYLRMFKDAALLTSTLNTVFFAVVSVALEMILGLMVAMVFTSDKRWARVAISIFMIPMIMAPVAIGTIWRMMLDASTGVVNYFLSFIGIPTINWLANPITAMFSVIMVNVWQLTPWVTVICIAGLKALPLDCMQAALVDGATPWQIFTKIVIPLMRPVLITVLMIRFIDAFKVFDTVYVMTNGGPGSATEMLPNYIYKQGLKFFDVGYAASLAIAFVVIMTVLSVVFMNIRRKKEVSL